MAGCDDHCWQMALCCPKRFSPESHFHEGLGIAGLYRTTSNEPSAKRGLDAEKPVPFLDPPKRTDPWTAPPDRDVGATGGTFRKSC